MNVVAVCPKCSEYRYQSLRPFAPGQRLSPEDFAPLGDAPAPVPGTPLACFACGMTLVFRRVPGEANGGEPPTSPTRAVTAAGAIATLFAAERDEKINTIRELPNNRILIVTTTRVVLIDVGALSVEAMP